MAPSNIKTNGTRPTWPGHIYVFMLVYWIRFPRMGPIIQSSMFFLRGRIIRHTDIFRITFFRILFRIRRSFAIVRRFLFLSHNDDGTILPFAFDN